ncbi:MAG TPA: hypothetical protein VI296_04255 [Candidatus Dormibacteraeota bacterium]
MEAFAIPDARDRLGDAVDALVDESVDEFSTHALGEDLVDIRRAIVLRRLHRFDLDGPEHECNAALGRTGDAHDPGTHPHRAPPP